MLNRIANKIINNKSILISTHQNPDGDAIGSELAIGICLENLNKDVTIFNQDDTPPIYQFLPYSDKIVHQLDNSKEYDLIFILDCADHDRGGGNLDKIISESKVINIDHHITNEYFGELNLIDKKASATGEIIYSLIKEIPAKITLPIATNIYTAILTDTGSFHYSNTSAKSLKIASEMIKIGVDAAEVAEAIYENRSLAELRLLGLSLNTIEESDNGMICSMVVNNDMFLQTGTSAKDTDSFVNYLSSISTAKVAALLKEISENCYKFSLRSKGKINVAEIASQFGGGGHRNAAGFTIQGEFREIKKQVFKIIRQRLDNYLSRPANHQSL